MDRGDRGAGVVRDAAGDDRHVDVLGLEPRHQIADVDATPVKVAAMARSADDYLIKPYAIDALVDRINQAPEQPGPDAGSTRRERQHGVRRA